MLCELWHHRSGVRIHTQVWISDHRSHPRRELSTPDGHSICAGVWKGDDWPWEDKVGCRASLWKADQYLLCGHNFSPALHQSCHQMENSHSPQQSEWPPCFPVRFSLQKLVLGQIGLGANWLTHFKDSMSPRSTWEITNVQTSTSQF